jgi:hypothetical protein
MDWEFADNPGIKLVEEIERDATNNTVVTTTTTVTYPATPEARFKFALAWIDKGVCDGVSDEIRNQHRTATQRISFRGALRKVLRTQALQFERGTGAAAEGELEFLKVLNIARVVFSDRVLADGISLNPYRDLFKDVNIVVQAVPFTAEERSAFESYLGGNLKAIKENSGLVSLIKQAATLPDRTPRPLAQNDVPGPLVRI